jgi:hypothetical protein
MSKNTVSKLLGLVSVVASAAAGAWTLGAKAAVGAAVAAAATWFLGFFHDAPGAAKELP